MRLWLLAAISWPSLVIDSIAGSKPNATLPTSQLNATSQKTHNCVLQEGDKGAIINTKTGQRYSLNDSCVELGPHVGYNRAAHQATVQAVKEFLTTTFKLKR